MLRGEGKKYGKESGVGQLFMGKSDGRTKPLPGCNKEPWTGLWMKTQGRHGRTECRRLRCKRATLEHGQPNGEKSFRWERFLPSSWGWEVSDWKL